MNNQKVIDFLVSLKDDADVRAELRTKSKDEVLTYARAHSFDFTDEDFDDTIWGYEIQLAEYIGEKFDLSFSLWETMWGKYYLDYLIDNVATMYALTK